MQCRKIILCFRYFSVFCKKLLQIFLQYGNSRSLFIRSVLLLPLQKCLVISSLILQFHKPGGQFQSFPKSPASAEILNLSFRYADLCLKFFHFLFQIGKLCIFSRLDFGSACCKQQCRCHSCNSQYDQDSSDHSLSQQDHNKTAKR